MKNRNSIFAALFALALTCLLAVIIAPSAFATATTANREIKTRLGDKIVLVVENDAILYQGAFVNISATGEAVNGADNTNHVAVAGIAEEYVDNADDGLTVTVLRGIFPFANGGSFTDANIDDVAYLDDNQTVTNDGGATANLVAGRIVDVDADGVWVDTRLR